MRGTRDAETLPSILRESKKCTSCILSLMKLVAILRGFPVLAELLERC